MPLDNINNQNWISVLYALVCFVEGIKRYAKDQFQTLHAQLISQTAHVQSVCPASPPCTSKKNLRDWCATCATWRQSILGNHKNRSEINKSGTQWTKIDSSKWPTDPAEVEKCFHPDWCNQSTVTNDDDVSVVIGKMINCNSIRNSLSVDPDEIRKIRNKVAHGSEVETSDKKTYCDSMMMFLQQLDFSIYPEAKEAFDKIQIFRDKSYIEIIKDKVITEHDMERLKNSNVIAQLEAVRTKELAVCGGVQVVSRDQWDAIPPKNTEHMTIPVSKAIVHHTVTAHCHNLLEGIVNAKFIQNCHMVGNGWDDIGYNFLIGEDGRVYEGRGWDKVGAHTLGWNKTSVAFAFMGNFDNKDAEPLAIEALQKILEYGVTKGYLTKDYTLYGHRDARPTSGPGNKLYAQIQCFDQFHQNETVPTIGELDEFIFVETETCGNVEFVARTKWGARPPKNVENMGLPVTVVFVHHTATTHCHSVTEGVKIIQSIQHCHMDINGFDDIGYNFLIGEDGRVYEGRGWDRVGAHTKGWNKTSVAFAFMGDFTTKNAEPPAIEALRKILAYGIAKGYLIGEYRLYGHRDARPTTSPGDKLYAQIKSFERYDHNRPIQSV